MADNLIEKEAGIPGIATISRIGARISEQAARTWKGLRPVRAVGRHASNALWGGLFASGLHSSAKDIYDGEYAQGAIGLATSLPFLSVVGKGVQGAGYLGRRIASAIGRSGGTGALGGIRDAAHTAALAAGRTAGGVGNAIKRIGKPISDTRYGKFVEGHPWSVGMGVPLAYAMYRGDPAEPSALDALKPASIVKKELRNAVNETFGEDQALGDFHMKNEELPLGFTYARSQS